VVDGRVEAGDSPGVEAGEPPADGRAARRERNVNAVLDVVVELFTEGALFPTVDQVSKRSGVSVRSIYRYFADPVDLHDAAIKRHREQFCDRLGIEVPIMSAGIAAELEVAPPAGDASGERNALGTDAEAQVEVILEEGVPVFVGALGSPGFVADGSTTPAPP